MVSVSSATTTPSMTTVAEPRSGDQHGPIADAGFTAVDLSPEGLSPSGWPVTDWDPMARGLPRQ